MAVPADILGTKMHFDTADTISKYLQSNNTNLFRHHGLCTVYCKLVVAALLMNIVVLVFNIIHVKGLT